MKAVMEGARNDYEGGMEEGGIGLMQPPGRGCQEPQDTRQSLGPRSAQHGAGVGNLAKPAAPAGSESQTRADHLAGSRPTRRTGRGAAVTAGPPRPMDGVGGVKRDDLQPLYPETPSDLRRLRYSDAIRLLNSTPLGPVINDRQVRRHRTRSEDAFCTDGRIDLVAYAAWLVKRFSQERESGEGSVSTGNILSLIERQEFRCALTGRNLEPATAAFDHVVSLSHGGEHVIGNAQILHRDVNRAKGVLTNEQFIQLCRDVVAWADSQKPQE